MVTSVVRIQVRGKVQGVGFRWSMVQQARALQIHGWVRNRQDGSVEATVAGDPVAVERIVAWARRGPRAAYVESVDVVASEGDFTSFEQLPTA